MALRLSLSAAVVASAAALQTPAVPTAGPTRAAVQMNTIKEVGDMSLDPAAGNYRRLSDALKAADVERRLEEDAIRAREEAAQRAREERARKVALLRDIPEETTAGTVDEFMFKEGVKEILEKLDYDLIGLAPVKARVREIASLLVVDKMRLKLGLETSVPSLHMGFTGAPGTGKTTVALRMGQILQRMGYCRTGHVVVATRDDLVGQYVGHTAPKTKEMVKKAMGGILLVDEAYYLYNAANDRDYGQESIEILLNVMENNKEDLIVVLAGYKDKMDRFYSFIPGMASRIGNHIEFPDYEDNELVEIGKVMCRDLEYDLGPGAEAALRDYLSKRKQMPFFANARTVRNAIDLARMGSAIRIFNEKMSPGSNGIVTEQELMTIMPQDFPEVDDGLVGNQVEEPAAPPAAPAPPSYAGYAGQPPAAPAQPSYYGSPSPPPYVDPNQAPSYAAYQQQYGSRFNQ